MHIDVLGCIQDSQLVINSKLGSMHESLSPNIKISLRQCGQQVHQDLRTLFNKAFKLTTCHPCKTVFVCGIPKQLALEVQM